MMRKQALNETYSLSEPSSISMDNFMLSGSETYLDPQLQNYTFSSFLETPPQISTEQLPSLPSQFLEQNMSTDQPVSTTTQNTYIEPMDNIVFDDVDPLLLIVDASGMDIE